jgi:hypothetical protein
MLANWMLYCAAVGVLLSGGALALERGLRASGRPTRWVWAGAMALTLALPAVARYVSATRAARLAVPFVFGRLPMDAKLSFASVGILPQPPGTLDLSRWDPALRLGWGASSAAVLLGLAAMAGVLARRCRGWSAAEVDGVSVLVSPDVGPAVVGLLRSRIVLPAWALTADEEARRLVLEHEREHVCAGDPRLLAAAIVFAALTPWNPAAWWQLRRLRLAIEVDCDARVLRHRGDMRAYGSALLEFGRRTARSHLPAATFAEPVSALERRIRIMTAPRLPRPLLRTAAFGAIAAALAAAAWEAPQPTLPSSIHGYNRAYRQAIRRHYPPWMRHAGITARVRVRFAVGSDGVARDVRVYVKPGADPAFAQAGRAMVGDFIFPPTRPKEAFEMEIDFAPYGGTGISRRYEDTLQLNRLNAEQRRMLTQAEEWLERTRQRMSAGRDTFPDPGAVESAAPWQIGDRTASGALHPAKRVAESSGPR